MRNIIRVFLFIVWSSNAVAVVDNLVLGSACMISRSTEYFTLPSTSITLSPDAPVGTILYSATASLGGSGRFVCSTPVSATIGYNLTSADGSAGTISVAVPGIDPSAKAFKTNIPGVAAFILRGDSVNLSASRSIPFVWTSGVYVGNKVVTEATYPALNNPTWAIVPTINILLVKSGTISPGSRSVNLATIPGAALMVTVAGSSNTSKLPNTTGAVVSRLIFQNAYLNLVSATCNAPMVPVNLGTHRLSSLSLEEGRRVSPWVDASINLTNCPTFYGIGGNATPNAVNANVMTVTITPENSSTSSTGMMPVDTGVNAATNLGIQMGWGTATSHTLLDFTTGKATKTYTMTSSQGSTYTIPLVARYRQTEAGEIGQGEGNGKVTYIIDYY